MRCNEVHFAWLETLQKNSRRWEGVTYPILARPRQDLSNVLGILDIEESSQDTAEPKATFLRFKRDLPCHLSYWRNRKSFSTSINDMPAGTQCKMEIPPDWSAYTHVQTKGEKFASELGREGQRGDICYEEKGLQWRRWLKVAAGGTLRTKLETPDCVSLRANYCVSVAMHGLPWNVIINAMKSSTPVHQVPKIRVVFHQYP